MHNYNFQINFYKSKCISRFSSLEQRRDVSCVIIMLCSVNFLDNAVCLEYSIGIRQLIRVECHYIKSLAIIIDLTPPQSMHHLRREPQVVAAKASHHCSKKMIHDFR